ncbi:MAG: LysM peptidoglycan-binding domain-containing protein [Acetivibrionales bacterium]|jgi:serine/threonine protein phosphatase PrpC
MGSAIKISFSAVSHIGTACTSNSDKVFANGRFIYTGAADHSQISLEVNDKKCLFALSENMEDEESGISLTSDLRKFYQKVAASSKDIYVKLDELVQCVEQSSNLIHSLSFGENDFSDRKPSFAGILIDDGNVAAVNLGNCRIYKLEGDTFKLLVNDYKRAERLLKMGIISKEQAEMLSSRSQSSPEEGKSTVKKSDVNNLREGVTYLICSSGITEAVNEDRIYDILASGYDTDETANRLVMEAVENEAEKCMTALIIKTEVAGEDHIDVPVVKPARYKPASAGVPLRQARMSVARRERGIDAGKIVFTAILIFLAAAVIFGGYKLWAMLRGSEAKEPSTEQEDPISDYDDWTDPTSDLEFTDDTVDGTEGIDGTSGGDDLSGGTGAAGSGETGSDLIGDEEIEYIVKEGDMLMMIAKKYYGDESYYTLIMEKNNIRDANLIYPGQKLILPPKNR